jgi:peptide/nickel transport system permease protein
MQGPARAIAALRARPRVAAGAGVLACVLLFCAVGRLLVGADDARPLAAPAALAPSFVHPFGTDDQGRDLFATAVVGVPRTLWIGLLAGALGLVAGAALGLAAGYAGGWFDTVAGAVTDALLAVPGLVVLVTVASAMAGPMDATAMALVIASLGWMRPARAIRAQVLSLRTRGFVEMAKLSGVGSARIVVREILPHLWPYLAAMFVVGVSSAMLASIGLDALGLGSQHEPTIGMTLHRAVAFNAILRGLWWWWAPPIAALVLLFVGLFLLATGPGAQDDRSTPGAP